MSTVKIAVQFDYPTLDDEAAKQLARQVVEARGLEVASATIVKPPSGATEFVPKAGKPGSLVVRDGRTWQVWSDGPRPGELWVQPVERQDGDSEVFLVTKSGRVEPHHGNGNLCASKWHTEDGYERVETPCGHWSHQAAS